MRLNLVLFFLFFFIDNLYAGAAGDVALSKILIQGAEGLRVAKEYLNTAQSGIRIAGDGLRTTLEYYNYIKEVQEALSDGLQLKDSKFLIGSYNAWILEDTLAVINSKNDKDLSKRLEKLHRITSNSYQLSANLSDGMEDLAKSTDGLYSKISNLKNKDTGKATVELLAYILKIQMDELQALAHNETLEAYYKSQEFENERILEMSKEILKRDFMRSKTNYKGTIIQ